ncbi:MAG: oligosaccharide flippase family protein [bacterium]
MVENSQVQHRLMLSSRRISPVLLMSIGEGTVRVFSFVAMLVMANRLGKEAFGIVSFAWSIMAFAHLLAGFQLDVPLLSSISGNRSRSSGVIGAFLILRVGMWAFVSLLIVVGIMHWNTSVELRHLLYFCCVALLFQNISLLQALKGSSRFREATVAMVAGAVCNMMVVVLFLSSPHDLNIVGVATVVSAAVVAIMAYRSMPSCIEFIPLTMLIDNGTALLRSSLPLVLAMACMIFLANIDSLLLGSYRTLGELGEYRVACRICEALFALITPAGAVALVVFSKSTLPKEQLYGHLSSFVKTTLSILLTGIGVFLTGGSSLLHSVFFKEYENLTFYLSILLIGMIFRSISVIIGSYFIALNAQRKILIVSIVLFTFNGGMNLLMIPRYGALAASAIFSMTFLLEFVLYLWLMRREAPLSIVLLSVVHSMFKGICLVFSTWCIRIGFLHTVGYRPTVMQDVFGIIAFLFCSLLAFRKEFFQRGDL